MKQEDIQIGRLYYSQRKKIEVMVIIKSGEYVIVRDEEFNSYALPAQDLQEISPDEMEQETKLKILRFLTRTLFGEDVNFTLTRKTLLKEIARDASQHPNSRVLCLKILRLDGSSLKEAMAEYERLFHVS
jgi:hypothetical protein